MRTVTIMPTVNEPTLLLSELVPLAKIAGMLCLDYSPDEPLMMERREISTCREVNEYGIYLGDSDMHFIPEVVCDQEGCYTLVFKRK